MPGCGPGPDCGTGSGNGAGLGCAAGSSCDAGAGPAGCGAGAVNDSEIKFARLKSVSRAIEKVGLDARR
jgi:hypothetical protein